MEGRCRGSHLNCFDFNSPVLEQLLPDEHAGLSLLAALNRNTHNISAGICTLLDLWHVLMMVAASGWDGVGWGGVWHCVKSMHQALQQSNT